MDTQLHTHPSMYVVHSDVSIIKVVGIEVGGYVDILLRPRIGKRSSFMAELFFDIDNALIKRFYCVLWWPKVVRARVCNNK